MSVSVKVNGTTYGNIDSVRLPLADGSGYAKFNYAESEIEDTAGKYTVTNNLTKVTTSNPASTVDSGTPYSATLIAAEGYTLEGAEVTVTIDGIDFTSSVYLDGEINIATVSGNIVISATAIDDLTDEEVPMTFSQDFSVPTIYADNGDTVYEYYVEGENSGKVWTSDEVFAEDTEVRIVFDNTTAKTYQIIIVGSLVNNTFNVHYAETFRKGSANGDPLLIGTYTYSYTVRAGYRLVVFTYIDNDANLVDVTATK